MNVQVQLSLQHSVFNSSGSILINEISGLYSSSILIPFITILTVGTVGDYVLLHSSEQYTRIPVSLYSHQNL